MMVIKKDLRILASLAVVLVGMAILLAGCLGQKELADHSKTHDMDMPSPPPQANVDATNKAEVQIVIDNFVFTPSDVTVAPGTKVTWINKDDAPHTATSVDKKFNSGGLDTDDKFSFVFNDKGEYPYICTLHPQMKASIKVK
jgi:plastocyanin